MEVVLLIEFETEAPERAALLERVGALALTGRGRLSFLGTAPGEAGKPRPGYTRGTGMTVASDMLVFR